MVGYHLSTYPASYTNTNVSNSSLLGFIAEMNVNVRDCSLSERLWPGLA